MKKGRERKMISRNEKGKLVMQSLDMEIFIGELFEKCQTEHEVEWVQKELTGTIDTIADERICEIEEN